MKSPVSWKKEKEKEKTLFAELKVTRGTAVLPYLNALILEKK